MPEEVSSEIKVVIHQMMEDRGWIINSYAQFENLLSDLVRRARALDRYADLEVPYRTDSRISRVRELLAREGELSRYALPVCNLISRFESFEQDRLNYVHAFATVLVTPRGEIGLEFVRYRAARGAEEIRVREVLRPQEIASARSAYAAFADEALHLFHSIHRAMGWEA